MNNFETKDNTGTFFRNEKKEKDNQPDYTGTAMIDGVKKRIAAWIKDSKNGKKYMSISFSEFKEFEQAPKSNEPNGFDDSQDIPF